MTLKFRRDFAQLKARVKACRVAGEWRYIEKNDLYQFKAETGENLNWWPSTGTVTFQGGGKPKLARRFAQGLAEQGSPLGWGQTSAVDPGVSRSAPRRRDL